MLPRPPPPPWMPNGALSVALAGGRIPDEDCVPEPPRLLLPNVGGAGDDLPDEELVTWPFAREALSRGDGLAGYWLRFFSTNLVAMGAADLVSTYAGDPPIAREGSYGDIQYAVTFLDGALAVGFVALGSCRCILQLAAIVRIPLL